MSADSQCNDATLLTHCPLLPGQSCHTPEVFMHSEHLNMLILHVCTHPTPESPARPLHSAAIWDCAPLPSRSSSSTFPRVDELLHG